MSEFYDFIKECGVFFVLTVNNNTPEGRPFGAIMEDHDHLYISTSSLKAVHRQLKANPQIQIVALKPETRKWVRASGFAKECNNLSIKQKMLEECPVLKKHFTSADNLNYIVFQMDLTKVNFY